MSAAEIVCDFSRALSSTVENGSAAAAAAATAPQAGGRPLPMRTSLTQILINIAVAVAAVNSF